MSIRSAVLDQVKLVAEQQRKTLAPLTDDLPLVGSGLDSLCIALVVANLEDELGVDPFGVMGSVDMPVTLGEFIHFYESAPAAKA
ncbi:MAG: acyl carrier protein [Proteobacteria bacterium]|nr:acyl carrier protein [Pseudomonadota bacterium]